MKTPDWFAEELAAHGRDVTAGHTSRDKAAGELAALAAADGALTRDVITSWSASRLDAWLKAAAPADAGQLAMFPGLPRVLKVTPSRARPVAEMNGHDWDMARNVIENRTRHAIDGAEADRKAFTRAYERIRPLLSGALTTADVIGQLTASDTGT